jgi:hypothetical protein
MCCGLQHAYSADMCKSEGFGLPNECGLPRRVWSKRVKTGPEFRLNSRAWKSKLKIQIENRRLLLRSNAGIDGGGSIFMKIGQHMEILRAKM